MGSNPILSAKHLIGLGYFNDVGRRSPLFRGIGAQKPILVTRIGRANSPPVDFVSAPSNA
jgi:hypothetical protein